MIDTAHRNAEARWRDEQSEYAGLTLGMLFAKGVPVSMHRDALEHVLLACWASLRLDLMPPEANLPHFYQEDDPLRASVHNWFLLLVEAWACRHLRPAPLPRPGHAAAVARDLLRFVDELPAEARSSLRKSAGLVSVN